MSPAMGSYTPLHLRPLGVRLDIYPAKGVTVAVPAAPWEAGPKVRIIDDTRLFGLIRLGDRYRCSGSVEFMGYETTPSRTRCQAIVDNVISVCSRVREMLRSEHGEIWAGLRPMAPSGNPYLGPTPIRNLFVNAGHGHLSWTRTDGGIRATSSTRGNPRRTMNEHKTVGGAFSAVTRSMALIALLGSLGACGYLLPRAETPPPSELPAGAYRLDPEHAALLFKIDHLGFSTLIGRFDRFDATLDFDPDNPAASRLSAQIDPASIDFNLPKFEEDLRGPDWFDVARYPNARFDSREIQVTGENTGRITGDLTLHGVTHPVTLDVTFNGAGDSLVTGRYTLGFAATGTLARSAFGLGAYTPAVGDEVTLEIHAEFQRVR